MITTNNKRHWGLIIALILGILIGYTFCQTMTTEAAQSGSEIAGVITVAYEEVIEVDVTPVFSEWAYYDDNNYAVHVIVNKYSNGNN